MTTADKVIEVLEELCPGVDCRSCRALVDERILDSLTMVALIAELEDVFDVEIPPVDIVADNFNTLEAISQLMDRLSEEEND